ncbi:hypothetical protein FGIG_02701 [Fasciola gigantica]|uniref:Uncharacterized protein n=1 Tax=Fasciola gigantica TaxID=46835 RepID=A0A504YB67_FASGI|nr:hypothetical protein FGIG_02701 [Fasciola gigantica]
MMKNKPTVRLFPLIGLPLNRWYAIKQCCYIERILVISERQENYRTTFKLDGQAIPRVR